MKMRFAFLCLLITMTVADVALWKDPPDQGLYYGSCISYGDDGGPSAAWKNAFPQGLKMGPNTKTSDRDVTLTIKGTEALQQCAVAEISDCYFNINYIQEITFDYEISGCYDVWAAPLWFTRAYYGCGSSYADPITGTVPYGCASAGEIDVLETGNGAHHYDLWTNFAGGAGQHAWFTMDSTGTTHTGTMTTAIDENGGLTITNSAYPGKTVRYTQQLYKGSVGIANGCVDDGPDAKPNAKNEANRCMYKFVSDIWHTNLPSTQVHPNPTNNQDCTVSVKNLKMTPRSGAQFDDIFKAYTPNWKETYAKGGKITQKKASSICTQLLSTADTCTTDHVDRPGATSEDKCKAMSGCCFTAPSHCEKCTHQSVGVTQSLEYSSPTKAAIGFAATIALILVGVQIRARRKHRNAADYLLHVDEEI